jgi:hypothetical protein
MMVLPSPSSTQNTHYNIYTAHMKQPKNSSNSGGDNRHQSNGCDPVCLQLHLMSKKNKRLRRVEVWRVTCRSVAHEDESPSISLQLSTENQLSIFTSSASGIVKLD